MPTFHVYYRKDFHPRLSVNDYHSQDYVCVGILDSTDKESVFYFFQGEIWSPNGERQDHIRDIGTDHTSMSCGDMLIDPDGVSWMCMPSGWEVIPDRFRTE